MRARASSHSRAHQASPEGWRALRKVGWLGPSDTGPIYSIYSINKPQSGGWVVPRYAPLPVPTHRTYPGYYPSPSLDHVPTVSAYPCTAGMHI